MNNQKIFIAIDIEKVKRSASQGLQAIGIVIGEKIGKEYIVIEKRVFCAPFPKNVFDPNVMDQNVLNEFWSRDEMKEIIKMIDKNSILYEEALGSFVEFFNSVETRYPQSEIILISDNPSFDIGNLDAELENGGFRKFPLRYSNDGKKYRQCNDPKQRLKALSLLDVAWELADKEISHDHYPENDAHHHFLLYTHAEQASLFVKSIFDLVSACENDSEIHGDPDKLLQSKQALVYELIRSNPYFVKYREQRNRNFSK